MNAVAVIGCGRIAGHHCRSILQTPGLKLAAVCDLEATKADAYSKEFGIPSFTRYPEMFEALPEIGTVVIATPSGMHFEHAVEVMERYRKNVIVEKPTFMKPSQLKSAYQTARKLGLHVFPVFQNRHNAAVQRVLAGMKSGELGKLRILSVRVRWCRPQRYYDLAPWRGTFAMDGGALTNQGIHHIDLVRQFGGELRRVNAVMRTLGADIEVEDTVTATLDFESGAVGALEITTAARPDDFEASISVVCENGLAQIGGIAVNELQVYTPDPSACSRFSEDFSRNVYGNGHGKIYSEIAAVFSEGKPYPVDEADCLKTLNLLNAFYRSDEAGQWVQVDSRDASQDESPRLGRADDELARLYRTV
jgi:UDP-N-acetyl-2-amino-2-deoxyglucuronate dehydrogenase